MPASEIEIIPGVVGPAEFVTDNWILGSGHEVRLVIRFDRELHAYACDEISVRRPEGTGPRPAPVTAEILRDIPVAKVIRTYLLVGGTGGHALRDLPNPDDHEPWGRKLPEGLKAEGPTDRTLKWVAHRYRLAVALGSAPTKSIQEAFDIPRTTAIRWVMAAREKGHLGPAEVGKRGEVGERS